MDIILFSKMTNKINCITFLNYETFSVKDEVFGVTKSSGTNFHYILSAHSE